MLTSTGVPFCRFSIRSYEALSNSGRAYGFEGRRPLEAVVALDEPHAVASSETHSNARREWRRVTERMVEPMWWKT